MSKNRAGRHAEEIEEKLRLAEAEAAGPHSSPPVSDRRRSSLPTTSAARPSLSTTNKFCVGAGQALAQGSRLIDGEHRLVLNRSLGDAELAKADEQSLAIR